MLECKEVKEYLDSIGLPYDEKETGDMKVLQMQYNQDLCAISLRWTTALGTASSWRTMARCRVGPRWTWTS